MSCNTPVTLEYVRSEASEGRLGDQLLCTVANSGNPEVYLSPDQRQLDILAQIPTQDGPDTFLPEQALGFSVQNYGMQKHRQLFTNRQLALINTLLGLVDEIRNVIEKDLPSEMKSEIGINYVNAVITYLGLITSKATIFHNVMARWRPGDDKSAPAFSRPVISMVWDYSEVNPFAGAGGDIWGIVDGSSKALTNFPGLGEGIAYQYDAMSPKNFKRGTYS